MPHKTQTAAVEPGSRTIKLPKNTSAGPARSVGWLFRRLWVKGRIPNVVYSIINALFKSFLNKRRINFLLLKTKTLRYRLPKE